MLRQCDRVGEQSVVGHCNTAQPSGGEKREEPAAEDRKRQGLNLNWCILSCKTSSLKLGNVVRFTLQGELHFQLLCPAVEPDLRVYIYR